MMLFGYVLSIGLMDIKIRGLKFETLAVINDNILGRDEYR